MPFVRRRVRGDGHLRQARIRRRCRVDELLLLRFGLAAALLLAVAVGTGALRGLPRRSVLAGLGMGVFGYAAQAGLYFSALARIDASLVALILYVYPVLVMVGAVVLGRERASVRRVWALGIALAGIGLVLAGAAPAVRRAGGVAGAGGGDCLHGVHPGWRPCRGRGAAARAGGAGLPWGVGTFAGPLWWRPGARLRRRRMGMGGRAGHGEHGRGDPVLLRRDGAGRPVGGVDSVDPRAGGDGGAAAVVFGESLAAMQ